MLAREVGVLGDSCNAMLCDGCRCQNMSRSAQSRVTNARSFLTLRSKPPLQHLNLLIPKSTPLPHVALATLKLVIDHLQTGQHVLPLRAYHVPHTYLISFKHRVLEQSLDELLS